MQRYGIILITARFLPKKCEIHLMRVHKADNNRCIARIVPTAGAACSRVKGGHTNHRHYMRDIATLRKKESAINACCRGDIV